MAHNLPLLITEVSGGVIAAAVAGEAIVKRILSRNFVKQTWRNKTHHFSGDRSGFVPPKLPERPGRG